MDISLFEVFIFLVAACAVVPIASRFRLGAVIGYLLAGVIIGPFMLSFITDAEKVMDFAEFGVVMMLFMIGLELDPPSLWRMRKSILYLGSLQLLLTSSALTAIGLALGFSWQASVAAGVALSLSSTALVVQVLREKNLMHTAVGETSFSILLFQDIAVIPILVLMPLLASKGDAHAISHGNIIAHLPGYTQALIIAGAIAFVIIGGRYISTYLFRAMARTNLREIFTALSLALIIGITLLMKLVGVSPTLGAFIAGVVLANSEYRRTLETDIEPFKGLLLGLFFISVGMGIDFTLFASKPLIIISGVVGLMAVKAVILWLLGRRFGLIPAHVIGYALALSEGGEFAFVLFQFAGSLSILTPDQAKCLTLVVALSIAATPLLLYWYGRFIVPRFMSILPPREYDQIEERNDIIIAGFGRFGQVIGRFLMYQGVEITVLEKDPDQIELLRKFGFKGYFGDATRLDVLRNAGAEQAKMLVIAVDGVESCLEIARMAKEEFPNLTIFARARNRQHAYDLHKLGVQYFQRELFDSSLELAKHILIWMGRPEADVMAKAEKFRRHDNEGLRESFAFYEDEPAMINYAKTRRQELEHILQNDIEEDAPPSS